MSDGTANASISVALPLTAGASYVFGAGFASNVAENINAAFCNGTVLIVKS